MKRACFPLLLPFASLLLAAPVGAQSPVPVPPTRPTPVPYEERDRQEVQGVPPKWSLEVVGGVCSGGPGGDLVAALGTSGGGTSSSGDLDHTSQAAMRDRTFWSEPTVWFASRRRLGEGGLHLGLAVGWTSFEEVRGFPAAADPSTPTQYALTVDSRLTTIATLVWYDLGRGVRIGAGPSLNDASLTLRGSAAPVGGTGSQTNLGFVLEAALVYPRDTPAYVASVLQYRWAGPIHVDGWQKTLPTGTTVTMLPATVSVNHAVFTIGVGTRF